MQLRDYQLEVITNVFRIFGIPPYGDELDPVVREFRDRSGDGSIDSAGGINGVRKNNFDGGNSEPLASGPGNDDLPPF